MVIDTVTENIGVFAQPGACGSAVWGMTGPTATTQSWRLPEVLAIRVKGETVEKSRSKERVSEMKTHTDQIFAKFHRPTGDWMV